VSANRKTAYALGVENENGEAKSTTDLCLVSRKLAFPKNLVDGRYGVSARDRPLVFIHEVVIYKSSDLNDE
jgi:hypothetical protein